MISHRAGRYIHTNCIPTLFLFVRYFENENCSTRDNVEEQETDQSVLRVESFLEPQTPSPTPPKKYKTSLDSLCQKFGETIQNIEKSLAAPLEQETADEIFMKTVLCLMKDLPVDIKDDFQAGIMEELYRLRKLCRNINV